MPDLHQVMVTNYAQGVQVEKIRPMLEEIRHGGRQNIKCARDM